MIANRGGHMRRMLVAITVLVGAGLTTRSDAGPSPPRPDEMTLFEEIPAVQAASKYEQRTSQAPSSVTIITAAEIKRFGYQTLGDVLRSVAGFYVTNDRNYSYLGVRGFGRPGDYNTRVLLLINGHRINDNIYDAVLLGTEGFLDLAAVERLEIVRGPSSSLYGTNAFFAVINIITKRGRDLKTAELSGSWASHNTFRAAASYGNRLANGVELYAIASALDSRGQDLYFPEFDRPETNSGLAVGLDHDRYFRVFGAVSYRDLTLQGGFSWRRKGIPTASYDAVFNDPRARTIDQRAFAELKVERPVRSWMTLSGRLFFDETHYEGEYPQEALNHDSSEGKLWGAEARATVRVGSWLTVVGGAELHHSPQQDQTNLDVAVHLADRRQSLLAAAFLQASLEPWRFLALTCGLRYDHHSSFGSTVNPRCALILTPLSKTTVKLIYGDAFRAPSAFEAYYHDSGMTQKPNPALEPEKIRTGEVAVEQQILGGVRATGSFFYNRITRLIDLRLDPGDGLLQFVNQDEAQALGVELSLDARWGRGWEARASYSFQDVKDLRTDRWLSNAPRHLAKANLLVPIVPERLFAGLELQYASARRTLAGAETSEYILANLTVSAPGLYRGLSLHGSVFNFFDKGHGHPASAEHPEDIIAQDRRSFWLELSYSF